MQCDSATTRKQSRENITLCPSTELIIPTAAKQKMSEPTAYRTSPGRTTAHRAVDVLLTLIDMANDALEENIGEGQKAGEKRKRLETERKRLEDEIEEVAEVENKGKVCKEKLDKMNRFLVTFLKLAGCEENARIISGPHELDQGQLDQFEATKLGNGFRSRDLENRVFQSDWYSYHICAETEQEMKSLMVAAVDLEFKVCDMNTINAAVPINEIDVFNSKVVGLKLNGFNGIIHGEKTNENYINQKIVFTGLKSAADAVKDFCTGEVTRGFENVMFNMADGYFPSEASRSGEGLRKGLAVIAMLKQLLEQREGGESKVFE